MFLDILYFFRVLLGLKVTEVTLELRDYQDSVVKWEFKVSLELDHQGTVARKARLVCMACQGILEIQV